MLTGPTLPVSLSMPIQFRQMAAIGTRACPAGSPGMPGPDNSNGSEIVCYRFTHRGMTVTALRSATVRHGSGGAYLLMIRFTPADASRFAALDPEAGQSARTG